MKSKSSYFGGQVGKFWLYYTPVSLVGYFLWAHYLSTGEVSLFQGLIMSGVLVVALLAVWAVTILVAGFIGSTSEDLAKLESYIDPATGDYYEDGKTIPVPCQSGSQMARTVAEFQRRAKV